MPELSRSQAAWNKFTDALKEIGEKITAPTGARGGRERAEGYRYLLRLISAAQDLEMEADRNYPMLRRMMTPIRKFKGDGTDTLYQEAKLDENLSYRRTVRRGDDLFFSATIYAYDETDAYYIADHLIDDDIKWDNVFGQQIAEIYLSEKRPEEVRNWIELKGRRPILFTREYYEEFTHGVDEGRVRQTAMNLECLSEVPPLEHYTEEELEAGLARVTDFIDDATAVSIGLSIFIGLNRVEYEGGGEGGTSERKGSMTRIEEGERILDDGRVDGAVGKQPREHGDDDMTGVDLEEATQCLAGVGAAHAVGAERRERSAIDELTDLVGADQSTVSKHLAVLKQAGIVSDRKEGLLTYYRVSICCLQGFWQCIESVLKENLKAQQAAIGA